MHAHLHKFIFFSSYLKYLEYWISNCLPPYNGNLRKNSHLEHPFTHCVKVEKMMVVFAKIKSHQFKEKYYFEFNDNIVLFVKHFHSLHKRTSLMSRNETGGTICRSLFFFLLVKFFFYLIIMYFFTK